MVNRTQAVLEEVRQRSHRLSPLVFFHVPFKHLLGDLQVVQSPLVLLVDLILRLELARLS